MTGPFDEDELFDDEWVDVYDMTGRKASLRHLATVRLHDKTYMILGSDEEEGEGRGELMLVREDRTVDGVTEYVVAHDDKEIESVMGQFMMRVLMDHADELPPELTQALEAMVLMDDPQPCGCRHSVGEFCYCDDPLYLQ